MTHGGEELGVLLDEKDRDAEQGHHEHEGRVDRVARQHHAQGTDDADHGRHGKGDGVRDGGGGEQVCHVPRTLPPKRLEILSRSTVRMEMFPVATSLRLSLWPPSAGRTP